MAQDEGDARPPGEEASPESAIRHVPMDQTHPMPPHEGLQEPEDLPGIPGDRYGVGEIGRDPCLPQVRKQGASPLPGADHRADPPGVRMEDEVLHHRLRSGHLQVVKDV